VKELPREEEELQKSVIINTQYFFKYSEISFIFIFLGVNQKVSKEEAIEWFKQKFEGNVF
jgi:hypothetical protein